MRDLWYVDSRINKGVYLRFSKGFDKDLKQIVQAFVRWIRKNYCFPIKLNIILMDSQYVVNSLTGEEVSASIFLPFDKSQSPRAQVSIGDYKSLDVDNLFCAECAVLVSIAHEITHYYQWLKDETGQGELSEKQARYKSKQVVNKYLDDYLSN